MKLDPKEPFTQSFPTFGHLKVNGGNYQNFKIAPPPNDKKRHDKVLDITRMVQEGPNNL